MKILKTLGIVATLATATTLAIAHSERGDDTLAGTVKGKITYDGKIPEMKPLTITAEQSKGCCATDEAMNTQDFSLVLDKDGGIANCIVTIDLDDKKPEVNKEPVKLDQKGCRFEPHVVIVPVGGEVAYLNSDGVSHNIHTYATKNEGLNKTVAAGSEMKQKFAKAEQVKVACDIHPWMTSYIFITDAAFSAKTDAAGNFQLEGLPAGEHKIAIWHEKLGKAKAKVTVAEDGSSELVEIKMGASKKSGKGKRRR